SVYAATATQTASYLDTANLGWVPTRTLVAAGASVAYGDFTVALSVENLANTRVVQLPLDPAPSPTFASTPVALADLAGFPLPGRSFYLALQWTH
ncbi:MAG: TonB-dependent receptor, partial [Proteobacteria bacterium]|nr:TonB-dependent receptor [Pseudomonadota bacterium]